MNTRQQQQQGVARPGQGRLAGTFFGVSNVEIDSVCYPTGLLAVGRSGCKSLRAGSAQVLRAAFNKPARRLAVQRRMGLDHVSYCTANTSNDLRANARRSLPRAHHGAFREGFNGANAGTISTGRSTSFTQGDLAGLRCGPFCQSSMIGSAAQRGPCSVPWAGRSPSIWAERGRKWITIHS